jgi:hypothetical protein
MPWQSVNLSGEASAKAQEDALEAEKKAWKDKMVVDTLDFKVCPLPFPYPLSWLGLT